MNEFGQRGDEEGAKDKDEKQTGRSKDETDEESSGKRKERGSGKLKTN